MTKAPDEISPRAAAIERLGVLDRIADPALQSLVRIAAHVAGANFAAIHVLDDELQHRIASHQVDLIDTPANESMCRLVVEDGAPIVAPDATADQRFAYSPFVRGDNAVRFYASVPLRTSDGDVIGSVCAFDEIERDLPESRLALLEDIAIQASTHMELVGLVGELSQAATRDDLTGLANRLILSERMGQMLARQARHGESLAVAMVDLDGFKEVNDTHGHQTGDAVLREVARRLSTAVRAEDTVARIGGDEFVVAALMNPAEGFGARDLAARLEDALSEPLSIPELVSDSGIGATIGIALGEVGDSAGSVIKRADDAMYKLKIPAAR